MMVLEVADEVNVSVSKVLVVAGVKDAREDAINIEGLRTR